MMLAAPPARRVWLPAAVVSGAVIGGVAVYLNILTALALLGALALVLLLAAPSMAVPLIIAAAALDRFGPQWGDASIRVDLLAALLVAVVLLNRILVRTVSPAVLRSPLLLPLMAYAGANLLSSLVFAVERTRGLKLDLEICTAVLTYILVAALLRRRSDLETALKALWIVTVGEAALGLLFAAANLGKLTSYGVASVASGFPAAYGTMWEPNVFGSFLAGNFFVLLADYIGQKRRGIYTYALIVIGLGIAASLTRTVWIACVLGGIAFFIYAYRARLADSSRFVAAAGAAVGMGLIGVVLGSATPLGGRLTNIVNLNSDSAAGRLIWFREAISEWSRRPIFGSGTGSWTFGQNPGGPHAWLPSLFLLTLHDTGILGFGALLWAIWAFYSITIRGARGRSDLSLLAFGSAVGFTCLLIAFQTTTGFWFAYPWIVMVIGTTAARLHAEET